LVLEPVVVGFPVVVLTPVVVEVVPLALVLVVVVEPWFVVEDCDPVVVVELAWLPLVVVP